MKKTIIITGILIVGYLIWRRKMTTSTGTSYSNKIVLIAEGIKQAEGWILNPPSRSVRNNNPGNLKYAGQPGATRTDGDFAKFETYDLGWSALLAQLQRAFSGASSLYSTSMTLAEFVAKYTAATGLELTNYIKILVNKSGVTSDTPIGKILS